MVSVFDLIIVSLMVASALILYKKTIAASARKIYSRVDGGLRAGWETTERRPILLEPSGTIKIGGALGKRLYSLARRAPFPVSYIYTYAPVEKAYLASLIEEEIRKVEYKYTTTRLDRYKQALAFLEELYRDVSSAGRPVAEKLSVVVWATNNEHRSVALFARMLESETGVRFSLSEIECISEATEISLEAAASNVEPASLLSRHGSITIGVDFETGEVLTLRWPEDLEKHILVIGPTGMGKTVLLSGIAVQLSVIAESSGSLSVIVIDPKGDLSRLLEGVASRRIVVSNIENLPSPGYSIPQLTSLTVYDLSLLREADRNEASKRLLDSLLDYVLSRVAAEKIVIIVDEAWRLSSAGETVGKAVREGRSRGLYIVLASQDPSDFKGEIPSNAGTIIAFRGVAKEYKRLVEDLGLPGGMLERLSMLGEGFAAVRLGGGGASLVKIYPFNEYLKKARTTSGIAGVGV